MAPPDLLRGRGPALDLAGVRLTYADLRAAVAVRPVAGPLVLARTDPVGLLVDLYAGLGAGAVVAVGGRPDVVPPGTDLVLATSGTAGRPRLVARSLASWTSSFDAVTAFTGLRAGDRVAVTGPLTTTLQLFAAVHALASGSCVTDRAATADVVHGVPGVLAALPLDAARTVVAAGTATPPALRDRLGGRLVEYYGATELSFVAAGRPLRAFPGAAVEVRDGTLWVRSPYTGIGYAAGTGPWRTDGDWHTVGDRAEPDGDGLRLLGRPDAVDVGGATVVVAEVEAVLLGLPGVRAVAVVGVAADGPGSVLGALVDADDVSAVRRSARAALSGAALPRRWWAGPVPLTPAGKADRVAVEALVRAGSAPGRALP